MRWYPPNDWIDYTQSKLLTDEYTFLEKYITMLYMAVLQLGINELGPVNPVEMIVFTIGLICCSFLNALLFGDIVNLIYVLQSDSTYYQMNLDTTNRMLLFIDIPYDQATDTRVFILKTQQNKDKQTDLNEFLDILSPSMRIKLQNALYRGNLRKNDIIVKLMLIKKKDEWNGFKN